MLNRRGFLAGLGVMLAAPAVVRASSLMPIKGIVIPKPVLIYNNRTIRQWMDIEAIRNRNILVLARDYEANPTVMFRGIPIRELTV